MPLSQLRRAAEEEAARRLAAEEEAGRRCAAVAEVRRRRKADAKAARRSEAEVRAAAERAGVVAVIAALERRAAVERGAALAAQAAVFGGGCAQRSSGYDPELGCGSSVGGRCRLRGCARGAVSSRWQARDYAREGPEAASQALA